MTSKKPPVAVAAIDVPVRAKPSVYPEPYASRMAGRSKRQLGEVFGLSSFGVNLTTLAPGGSSALRHAHAKQDEFVFILSGTPTLHTNEGRTILSPKNPKQQVGTDQVPGRARTRRDRTLEVLLLAYLGASLLHFFHNAEHVQAYPNLPGWITRFSVYGTWIGITAGGLIGYVLYRFLKPPLAGLIVLCLYAAAGLDGLLHYLLAPIAQ
jgi:hypothetical protein